MAGCLLKLEGAPPHSRHAFRHGALAEFSHGLQDSRDRRPARASGRKSCGREGRMHRDVRLHARHPAGHRNSEGDPASLRRDRSGNRYRADCSRSCFPVGARHPLSASVGVYSRRPSCNERRWHGRGCGGDLRDPSVTLRLRGRIRLDTCLPASPGTAQVRPMREFVLRYPTAGADVERTLHLRPRSSPVGWYAGLATRREVRPKPARELRSTGCGAQPRKMLY